jgi:hypothetical protein
MRKQEVSRRWWYQRCHMATGHVLFNPRHGDEDVTVETDDKGTDDKGTDEKNTENPKTFTQDDVNRFIAEDKKKLREQNDRLIKELETIKSSAGMTEKEKEKLESQIEELRTQSMTEKERSQREKEKLETTMKTQVTELESRAKKWETLYTEEKITRSLMDASVENEAFSPVQIVQILSNNTRLIEDKETGTLVPKVRFNDVDKEGKPVTLELSTTEAVKRMKDLPDRYGNLFKSNIIGGLGSMNYSGTEKGYNIKDPEEYRKYRQVIKSQAKGN